MKKIFALILIFAPLILASSQYIFKPNGVTLSSTNREAIVFLSINNSNLSGNYKFLYKIDAPGMEGCINISDAFSNSSSKLLFQNGFAEIMISYNPLCQKCGRFPIYFAMPLIGYSDTIQPIGKIGVNIECHSDVLLISTSKMKKTQEFYDTLKEYMNVQKEEKRSVKFLELDSEKVKRNFGIDWSVNYDDWRDVKKELDKIRASVRPEYVIILGGVNIVPMPFEEKSLKGEEAKADEFGIKTGKYPPSDEFYVTEGEIPIILSKKYGAVIARMPTKATDYSDNEVVKQMKNAMYRHKYKFIKKKLVVTDKCDSAGCWLEKNAREIAQHIPNAKFVTADPYCYYKFRDFTSRTNCDTSKTYAKKLGSSDLVFFEAHSIIYGKDIAIAAFGERGEKYAVLAKSILADINLKKTLVGAGTCFAGMIDSSIEGVPRRSMALILLSDGAAVTIANTRKGKSFIKFLKGSVDILTFTNIMEGMNNKPIGRLLFDAKAKPTTKKDRLVRIMLAKKESIYQATELQLYGDPTIQFEMS